MIVESNHEGRFLRGFVKLRWRDITVCEELVMQAQRSESKLYNAYKTVWCVVWLILITLAWECRNKIFCGVCLGAILM